MEERLRSPVIIIEAGTIIFIMFVFSFFYFGTKEKVTEGEEKEDKADRIFFGVDH